MEFTYQLEDIQSIADVILKQLTSKTLLFYGDMGSGKTTLIIALSKQLGILGHVSSPTFSIVNEYEIKDGLIYHFDLYRIKNEEEALDFGIEDYLFSDHYVFIEWPERIEQLLPEAYTKITIKSNLDGSRTLYID